VVALGKALSLPGHLHRQGWMLAVSLQHAEEIRRGFIDALVALAEDTDMVVYARKLQINIAYRVQLMEVRDTLFKERVDTTPLSIRWPVARVMSTNHSRLLLTRWLLTKVLV